jgi:hypothetical protein
MPGIALSCSSGGDAAIFALGCLPAKTHISEHVAFLLPPRSARYTRAVPG